MIARFMFFYKPGVTPELGDPVTGALGGVAARGRGRAALVGSRRSSGDQVALQRRRGQPAGGGYHGGGGLPCFPNQREVEEGLKDLIVKNEKLWGLSEN